MKKVLVISSSPRPNSNSRELANKFVLGAKESGHDVELINICKEKINYCLGCGKCYSSGVCIQKDGFNSIARKVEEADVLVLASPVYFYSMSGQLKVFIDRMVQNYQKVHADIYIFLTAWTEKVENLNNPLEAIRGFSRDCLENCPEKGVILAYGVNEAGAIKDTPFLNEAYKMGKEC